MKNVSTFQVLLIGAFGLFALAGIFVFATYSGSSKSSTSIGHVVIWGVLPSTQMHDALNKISQTDSSFKNVTYVGKDPATFESDLTKAIAAGQGPDLVLVSQEQLASLSKDILPTPYTALSQRTFLNTFADACTIYLGPKGVYGIPIGIDPMVLYYNRSMLSSAGIAAPPATWEALTGLVPRVAQLTPTQNVSQALIALGSYNNIHDAQGVLSTLFLQAGVPMVTRTAQGAYRASLGVGAGAGGMVVPSNDISAPGEAVLRFYTQFADPTKTAYTWNSTLPDSQQAFLAGTSALYLGYASEASFLAQANPNLSFDVAPMPQSATAKIKTTYARVYALAIPRGSQNPAGALLAASGLSNQTSEKVIDGATGLVPSLRSLLAVAPQDPITSVAYTAAIQAKAWLSPSPADTDKIFSTMIQNVITGRSSITQALANAEQSIDAALQ